MQHPKLHESIIELDDTRTKLADVIESGDANEEQVSALRAAYDHINAAIIAIPHIKTPEPPNV